MSLTKKIRFEVFKRDGFKCGYCGKTPPDVTLEVDHVDPLKLGGSDDINNLITACFPRNRGKKAIPLDKIPSSLEVNFKIIKEKELQVRAYNEFMSSIRKREDRDIAEVSAVYSKAFPKYQLAPEFEEVSIRKFIRLLPFHEVLEAMKMAVYKTDDTRSPRYFCGICWNKIRGLK